MKMEIKMKEEKIYEERDNWKRYRKKEIRKLVEEKNGENFFKMSTD
jgi:hypothetical protein